MTQKDLDFIKDAFSQITDDIAGNPDWHEAARAVASDLGTLERELEKKVVMLSSNLDEAAEEYAENILAGGEDMFDAIADAFKAGAEWMAGQGKTKEAVIGMATEEIYINVSQQTLDELDLCPGDKVVVQIRKK